MLDMTKMRNQFHRACGYCIGYNELFNKKAEWVIYFLTTKKSSTSSPIKYKFNLPLDDNK